MEVQYETGWSLDEQNNTWRPPAPPGFQGHTHRFLEEITQNVPASRVSAGTFGEGSYTFAPSTAMVRVGNSYAGAHPVHGVSTDPASNWASFGHWDKQGTSDYAFMQNAQGRTLINASSGQSVELRVAGAGPGAARYDTNGFTVGLARMSTHPVHSTFAWFGHTSMTGSVNYGFMQNTAETLVDGPLVALRSGGANRLRALSDRVVTDVRLDANAQIYVTNWVRSQTSGTGWYHEAHGGGWYMNDAWIRAYNNKPVYSADRIRGLEADMTRWNGAGGHARFGYENNAHDGPMVRSDGYLWLMSANTVTFRQAGGDIWSCVNSGGWADLRANLATLSGTTMVITGVNQFGRASSRADIKTDIIEQRLRDQNPVWQLKPKRFKWNRDKVQNADEVNARNPNGVYGLVVDDVATLIPDAVHPDPYDGKPSGFDQNVLNGYIFDALLTLKEQVDALKRGTK